jgi:N-acetylmuramoyl-L-alanine amidase
MSSIPSTIDNPAPESKRARFAFPAAIQRLAVLLVLPLVFAACETTTQVKDTTRTFRTVVIDAGHGGGDSGARSRWGGMEKAATLDTALRLDPKLRAAGFKTVLTRKGDYFVPLNDRARISNQQDNAIFVSIHFNDAPSRRIAGVETYYQSRPALKIAVAVQHSVCCLPGTTSRGVKTANYRVLRKNEYPAVLVEGGFISNPREGAKCASAGYHEALAGAIAQAIISVRGPLTPAKTDATTATTAAAPNTTPATAAAAPATADRRQ